MNLDQTLLAISNPNDDNLTIAGISAAKQNWSAFYLELENLIDQFIADDTSLTHEQEPILFFGTLLLAELKYSPALEKCLHLFARSDSFLTPLETVFGETITELTPTLFFNVADGNTQALCNFISDGHQSMYGKGAAIEAVFAQYEVGIIDKNELEQKNLKYGQNKRSSEHVGLFGNKIFDHELHKKYLAHEKIENLNGLEVELIYEWEVGSMLIFDRTNLHCSSSVIEGKKIGLTTFTKK